MDPGVLEAIARTALQSAERDYQDRGRVFGILDSKAQNTAAIAGVLIGAILTVTGRSDFRASLHVLGPFLLVPLLLSAVTLFASVMLSLLTMHLRPLPAPMATTEAKRTLNNCMALADTQSDLQCLVRFYSDLLNLWDPALARLEAVNGPKAARLLLAQRLLGIGLALVATSVIELLFVSAAG